ncbi:hypothetical protein KUTeg_024805 [Tegillarca granosa]|uniref:Uncharacterized protein n=1 Tax=Tegillarca granosa TaxID=220873 RepID=A0ABQ9E2C1_TEGGR|nr:hypothetical protein KUTeg_024805 [Tegillarca granosa]
MESDVSENLETDEMYLMLQADMISIKRQEKALQHDIDDITTKLKSLIDNVGLASELHISQSNMPNPPTPSFLRNATRSITQMTNISTSSDEDYLLQQMMQGATLPLSDTTSSDSLYDDNVKPFLMDTNCNYMPSPASNYSPPDNTAVSVPNVEFTNMIESPLSSDISNGSDTTTTSDGYPKSSDTSSENQCVPECVPEQDAYDLELVSRMQYYSDFTIDRQHKIDCMTAKLVSDNGSESANSSSRKSSSIPRASSTMIEDFSPSSRSSGSSSKHRSTSIPQASSTMIEDPTSKVSSRYGSAEDVESVYTWSINDESDEENLEDSYLRNIDGHRLVAKPPLASKKVFSSSSSSNCSSKKSLKQSNMFVQLSDQCSVQMLDSLSVIEPSASCQNGILVQDSILHHEESVYKASTLPRTSTKLNILSSTKCSASSSLEARRTSLPDILNSPTSVSSSGIFAPYNSPDVTDRSNPASKTSQSTASDTKSNSPGQVAPPASIASEDPSPVVYDKKDPEFKMPKLPLKRLFRFRRNKGKASEKHSTPQRCYPSSVQSDPLMSKRKLFNPITPSSSVKKSQDIYLMDKRAVIKKFKRFSVNFRSRDKQSLSRIQTLANL